ncbi:unnamed protein product [Phaedon cochleariae]|uniref:Uncharacterized protein n=1 Tax=Phaedon cochleariae TaxID=80249 RepID=A0A9N9SE54_PHACE|nr:unnamed protein product [Phaedon cochleariae]
MAVLMDLHKPVKEKTMKVVDKKIYLLTHELKLAKELAANDESTRKKTLKNLKKWFTKRSGIVPFTEEDFQVIWKGLFYCMWMSDKPLVQEECADTITKLIHLPTVDASLLFFKAGLIILINEWFGIDQLRLDKFLMLVRRLLREMLIVLRNSKFRRPLVVQFSDALSQTILSTTVKQPIGLFMHFTEIFLEELAKVSRGQIHNDRLVEILCPFIMNMTASNDGRHLGYLRKHIFTYLIRQSNLGLEYQEKYDAWKAQGFPGSIASMQKITLDEDERMSSDDEDETSENRLENTLDPRAGRVNVELPQIKFNPKSIVAALSESKFHKNSTTQSRKIINVLIEQFTKLANGEYPLGIKKIERSDMNQPDTNIRKAANRLIKFEQKLLGKNKKRKHDKENDDEIQGKLRKIDDKSKNKKKMKELNINEAVEKTNNLRKTTTSKKLSKEKNTIKATKKSKNHLTKGVKQSVKIKNRNGHLPDNDNIECVFERNSGTWVVFEVDKEINKNQAISALSVMPDKSSKVEPPSNSGYSNSSDFKPEVIQVIGSPKKIEDTNNLTESSKNSPKSKSTRKSIKPFPKSSWDEPLKEGEYEVFIHAKKHLKKLNKSASQQNKHSNTPLKSIKGKSRLSLESGLVKNPFSMTSTPSSSTKKVKINMQLNKSQEIHEHEAQILSSPGIPYDASRKPSKPLLKASMTPSPLNPFYKKQLF